MNTPASMVFTSKANVLQSLGVHKELHIPPLFVFSLGRWREEPEAVVADIAALFPHTALAVRSSCRREDTQNSSGAGAFTSLLHIPSQDAARLADAILTVIAAYGAAEFEDQVLIQPMIDHIVLSGVIMTRVLTDGAPYYVINYDDESGCTDTVTGGSGVSKTVYVFRDAAAADFDSGRLRNIVGFARRVESLCGHNALDMEFCLDAEGLLHLLQVRPICTGQYWIPEAEEHIRSHIDFVKAFIRGRMKPWPGLYGQRTMLGVMPDWNPAEMIGITPRPLAASLYRELITRRVWSQAREHMGYRPMPPEELMLLVAGRPYIDVRASFNSFLPAGLDGVTCEALISAWLDRLDRHPQLHDKVEFEVAQTLLDFSFDQHLDARYPDLLPRSRREAFRQGLRELTLRNLTSGLENSRTWAFDAIAELRNRQAARPLIAAPHGDAVDTLPRLLHLLEECRSYGTLPFSVLARHAFMAESLLRSAVARGALAPERLAAFKTSLHTVSGELSRDFVSVCQGRLDRASFLQRYGHLRPSSYDILSQRYADREGLFMEDGEFSATESSPHFAFTPQEEHDLDLLLREASLDGITPALLEAYARQTIAGREAAKCIFTRNLSDILELLAVFGESAGIDREEVSFLNVQDCLEWTTSALLRPSREYFGECVAKGRALHDLGRGLKLGYLIRSPRDVYVVPQHRSAPNFVGQGTVQAPVAYLRADSPCSAQLSGRIVCIENADPGFDWIFTRGIAGLVTLFGGANSHMAIRCAEYGLPAAIGVGEKLFAGLAQAASCRLSPGAGIIQAV